MTTSKVALRSRCKTWGGVVLTCTIIPEYWEMPQVTVVTIKNQRGVHTLILNGIVRTHNNLLEKGLRVKVIEYFGRVMEIQYGQSDAILWESEWELGGEHIGYNAHHHCEHPENCTHWVHFYEMTQEARCLFSSLYELGGFDDYGHHYWHPSILWGGQDSWEYAAEVSHTVVCIDTNLHFGLHLAIPGLHELREAWKIYIASRVANSEEDFQVWLKSIKLCGAFKGWWRFSADGSGKSLFDELVRLGILSTGGSHDCTE